MDLKKITTKLVSTTMSNEDPQLIFLSSVQLELLLPCFIHFFPNSDIDRKSGLAEEWFFEAASWVESKPLQ